MNAKSKILAFLLLNLTWSFVYSQDDTASDRIRKIKKERLQSSYETWNDCYINGLLDTRDIEDSIHGFSIVVPRGHHLKIYKKDHFRIMRFYPDIEKSKSDIVMEIWFNTKKPIDAEASFDQAIGFCLDNKFGLRIGTQEIAETLSYWIESYNKEATDGRFWEVSFHIQNPKSRNTIIIKQKSNKKRRYSQDFCLYGSMIKQLKWL